MRGFIVLGISVVTGSAMAMEPGTYRPGQVYHSITAQNANACAAQCLSDSQCKGWNFISVKNRLSSGICEFNARRAAPISSPVSVSGDSIGPNRLSTRMISGGSRTLRVGSPSSTLMSRRPAPVSFPKHVLDAEPQEHMPQTHVKPPVQTRAPVRTPLPGQAQYQAQPAAFKAAPRLQHSLDTLPPQHYQRQVNPARPSSAPIKAQPMERMQQPVPRPQAAPQLPPVTQQVPPQRPHQLPMPNVEAPRPVAQAPSQKHSLFGSLHDDVKIPRPLTPEDIPSDQDAPIATVSSVPVKKGVSDTLYGMAGSQAR